MLALWFLRDVNIRIVWCVFTSIILLAIGCRNPDNAVATPEKDLAKQDTIIHGCFYCEQTFSPHKITEWIEEPGGEQTAICPKCGIDSVLGEELPIADKAFLSEMNRVWFG